MPAPVEPSGAADPLRVLIAHNRYSAAQPSGENVVVDSEVALLRAAGVQVSTYARSSDEIAEWSPAQKVSHLASPAYARQAQTELAALLDRERPDVLHLHNVYPLLSPWVVRTAKAHGVPVVQTIHNFRHTCVNGSFFRDGHDCRDCLGHRLPVPAVRHRCYRGSLPQSAVMAGTLALHRDTWRQVDRYIALTDVMADYLAEIGMRPDQISVKPNCVSDPGPHDLLGTGFAYVGRLSPEKGIAELLLAWEQHPDGALGPLRIVGDGPLAALVRAAADRRTDIDWHGRVEHERGLQLMREAAALVVPSMWEEVCPMVAVEALACARPLLTTDRGGLPFLVGDDGGWTVPPTVAGLADGLQSAHRDAPAAAPAARARYERLFTTDVVTGQLIDIYTSVRARDRVTR